MCDHIAHLKPGVFEWAVCMKVGYHDTVRHRQAKRSGEIAVNRLPGHACPGALKAVIARARLTDEFRHQVRRDRKADAVGPTGAGQDRRVDTNQIAIHINQRPAGIAGIDRRIRLDEIAARITRGDAGTRQSRNNPARHCLAHTEGVANGQNQFTHFNFI